MCYLSYQNPAQGKEYIIFNRLTTAVDYKWELHTVEQEGGLFCFLQKRDIFQHFSSFYRQSKNRTSNESMLLQLLFNSVFIFFIFINLFLSFGTVHSHLNEVALKDIISSS